MILELQYLIWWIGAVKLALSTKSILYSLQETDELGWSKIKDQTLIELPIGIPLSESMSMNRLPANEDRFSWEHIGSGFSLRTPKRTGSGCLGGYFGLFHYCICSHWFHAHLLVFIILQEKWSLIFRSLKIVEWMWTSEWVSPVQV